MARWNVDTIHVVSLTFRYRVHTLSRCFDGSGYDKTPEVKGLELPGSRRFITHF